MGPGTHEGDDDAQNTSRVSSEPNTVNQYNAKPTTLGVNLKMPVETTQHKPTDMTMTIGTVASTFAHAIIAQTREKLQAKSTHVAESLSATNAV